MPLTPRTVLLASAIAASCAPACTGDGAPTVARSRLDAGPPADASQDAPETGAVDAAPDTGFSIDAEPVLAPAPVTMRSVESTPDLLAEGATLFVGCASCHGPTGGGIPPTGPRLNSKTFLAAASDAFLKATIVGGRDGTIMWSNPRLTEPQLDALVAFIRSWDDVPPAELDESPLEGDVGRGKALYDSVCASCHGRSDTRDPDDVGTDLRAPDYMAVASDGFLRYMIERGKTGTRMMPFGQASSIALLALSREQIDDVISFLRLTAGARAE